MTLREETDLRNRINDEAAEYFAKHPDQKIYV